nr:hypothetical protein [Xanthomonas maliensis]
MLYTDVYRYADDGRLYVYRSQRKIDADDIQSLLGSEEAASFPLSVWSTYGPQGNVIATAIGRTEDSPMPVPLYVRVARLPLYASDTAVGTRRYLVQGDRADALDVSADGRRIKLRYHSATAGELIGWADVDAAKP